MDRAVPLSRYLHRESLAGLVAAAVDPLDGAIDIDTNVSFGTIFSVAFAGDASMPRGGLFRI